MPRSPQCDDHSATYIEEWFPSARPHWDVARPDQLRANNRNWEAPTREAEVCVLQVERPIAERFLEHAEKWQRETEHLSSPTQMMVHPTYQAILGLAREDERTLIRLMLEDLRDNRRMWFWALSYLTKENPIKPEDAGKLDKMIAAWIEWGKRQGRL